MAENSFIDAGVFLPAHYVTRQSTFGGIPARRDVPLNYKMDHPRRGVALVFNHEVFTNPTLKTRSGTDRDVIALEETFQNLGFEFRLKNNNSKNEILNVLDSVAAEDHTDADCLVVVVLSHGGENRLHAKDKYYNVDDLWMPFTSCQSLAGKPKLFFLQACRGTSLDTGMSIDTNDSYEEDDFRFSIPSMADVALNYSTVDGFVAYRERYGSPFIQALCSELNAKAATLHFEDVMLHVRRNVAFTYSTNNDSDARLHENKQVPQTTSTLTKFIYFTQIRQL